MTVFRPCIDLHQGQVKQIVGGTLSDAGDGLRTNFVAEHGPAWYAQRYRDDGLRGGHVIKLGPGNDTAAREALAAWPGGLHLGGGIDLDNARDWLEAGAEKVIVTSWLFPQGVFAQERLASLSAAIGSERLVVDVSCRRRGDDWLIAIDRWQTVTAVALSGPLLAELARHCSEFLVHAADVEGLCRGIDHDLVSALGRWSTIPCVYAGGAKALEDLVAVERLSGGAVALTYGSALDLFGGARVRYADLVGWNLARRQR
ncbi:MAG: phosphoribosylformimino-5-aminoimidazole carboxamide ribotide isomerase [Planctomycetes bacterium]|nr:phosphoribosylformimino-5-aminoimidazole carboxamide ribotide isomerase [Planctomycetota bacterium]